MTVVAAKVTPRGVLVPRALIATWGDLREVEIEKYADTVVIRPRPAEAAPWRGQVIGKMKAAGLIEEMPWPEPPVVSPEARACPTGQRLKITFPEARPDILDGGVMSRLLGGVS